MQIPKRLDIKDWILSNFKGALLLSDNKEVKFPCPKCGHASFYFNLIKCLGFCHRCHFSPNLNTLTDIIGSEPFAGSGPFFSPETRKSPVNAHFPAHAVPVRNDSKATEALACRGISLDVAETFQIRVWRDFVMVPVYDDQKLVNIVSRRFDRTKSGKEIFSSVPHKERYLYQKGIKTTDYLFNFDRHKKFLTLVENTFNSILFCDHNWSHFWAGKASGYGWYQVCSNFGSYLSDKQIEKIKNSAVESVFILWDSKAIATKAVQRLKQEGIRAGSFFLRDGQPDDYPFEKVSKWVFNAHLNMDYFEQWAKSQPESFYYLT